MNDKFSECNTPFTKCWCEAVPGRQNNPHCKSLPSVPIDNPALIIGMIFLGILVFLKINNNLTK